MQKILDTTPPMTSLDVIVKSTATGAKAANVMTCQSFAMELEGFEKCAELALKRLADMKCFQSSPFASTLRANRERRCRRANALPVIVESARASHTL